MSTEGNSTKDTIGNNAPGHAMNTAMRLGALWQQAGLALCRLHCHLLDKRDHYPPASSERRLMLASAAVVCGSMLIASSANAQDGIAGMLNTAGNQFDSGKAPLGKIFSALGFGGAGFGGWNWWRKGKEGEQSHIKGSQIIVPILAGAGLGAIGYVLIKAGETVGIPANQHGVVPT